MRPPPRSSTSCFALLVLLALLVSAAAAEDEPVLQLYLAAALGSGVAAPAGVVSLTAKAAGTKRLDCVLPGVRGVPFASAAASSSGSGSSPASLSAALPAGAQAAAAAAVAAAGTDGATRCEAFPLASGTTYSLLAPSLSGANHPQWLCLAAAPGPRLASAPQLELSPVLVTPAVVVPRGVSEATCVAVFIEAQPAAVAAAASIDWQAVVHSASAAAVAGAAATSCAPLNFTLPVRATRPRYARVSALSIKGSRLFSNRAAFRLRGINWFGFNVAMGMVDGLWAGGTDLATDFGKISYQLRLLGYNAVRLPFTFTNLANTAVWYLQRDCTPASSAQLRQRLTDPSSNVASDKAFPPNASPVGNTSAGLCNDYLPRYLNQDRLLFVAQQFINLGFYVVLDYHPAGSEDHALNVTKFASAWAGLWARFMCLPNFRTELAGRLVVDVMNEPDSMGIRWEASADKPGAQQLYLAAADAIWALSPGAVLFMFEGTGQTNLGLNWGNGFVINSTLITSKALSDPRPFFTSLVTRAYGPSKQQASVMLGPHVYPPSITGATFLGAELYAQLNNAFNWAATAGWGGATMPVVVGETGSAMTAGTDLTWHDDFAAYATGSVALNKRPVDGWAWWAFNENSGDTGGIVMNNWQDLNWTKLRYMISKLGLQPWWLWPRSLYSPRGMRATLATADA